MDDSAELRAEAQSTLPHPVWTRGGPVYSQLTDASVHSLHGRSLADFGDSAASGLWAFAVGSWVWGLFQVGLLPATAMASMFPMLLCYAGLLLAAAGFFLLRRNNMFLATGFCSFGAFNVTRGIVLLCVQLGVFPPTGITDVLQGVMLEAFAWIALSLAIAALRMNVVLLVVWACAFVACLLSGFPYLSDSAGHGPSPVGLIGGCFILAAGTAAFYAGSALVINSVWQREILPLGGKT